MSGRPFALLAEYADPSALTLACRKVRDAGYSAWDAHTPFPIHGLERAMGLPRSWVSAWVLLLGLGGAGAGMAMQIYLSAEAYPLVISGKPLVSWPAFVPIAFECGVLGGALGAIVGMLFHSGLPRHHHGLFESDTLRRASDDGFFISIEASDPRFDVDATGELLREAGALQVEVVPEGEEE